MRVPIMKKGGGGGGYSAGASEYSTGLFTTVGTTANVYEEVFVYTGFRPMAVLVVPAQMSQEAATHKRAIMAFAPNGVLGDSFYIAASNAGKKTAGDDNSITRITDEGFYVRISYLAGGGWKFWAIGGQGSQFIEASKTVPNGYNKSTMECGFRPRAMFVYDKFTVYRAWTMMCPNGEFDKTVMIDGQSGCWRLNGGIGMNLTWSITEVTDTGFGVGHYGTKELHYVAIA